MGSGMLAFGLTVFMCLALTFGGVTPAQADLTSASDRPGGLTARVDPEASRIADFGADLHVELALSRAVPWRAFILEEPRRLVLDFAEVDFAGAELSAITSSDSIDGLSMGQFAEGWSRLVISLSAPMTVETAGMGSDQGDAVLKIQLAPSSDREFSAAAGAPESEVFAAPGPTGTWDAQTMRELQVVIDPGQGGIAPGADEIMPFARDLRAELEAHGIGAILTSYDMGDLPEGRDRPPEADAVLSFREKIFDPVRTEGGVVSNDAESSADRSAGGDREVSLAEALSEMPALAQGTAPRLEAGPRAEALAAHLVTALARGAGNPRVRPQLRASFSVLHTADIPAVRLEIGFPSRSGAGAPTDDPAWRQDAVAAIRSGLEEWASGEADFAGARRY